MFRKTKGNYCLVKLGESSNLKTALNLGVASLTNATEGYCQPHLCLNEVEGLKVLKKISQNPTKSNTEIHISIEPILSHNEMWLNINFFVFLDKICFPINLILSPRQTSYICNNLSPEIKEIVKEKIRKWFFKDFIKNLNEAVSSLKEQFNKGDMFVEDTNKNKIFDMHGNRGIDIPYTELNIVGNKLAWVHLLYSNHFIDFSFGDEGYIKADNVLFSLQKTGI